MPEVRFVAPRWHDCFRPLPPNVRRVPFPDCLDETYDAVIEDDPRLPAFDARAPVKVWLQHCEYNQGPELPRAMERATRVVTVSPHRRATMRHYGFDPRVRVIGFYFDVEDWPQVEYGAGGAAGTAHNCMAINTEVRDLAEAIAQRLPLTVIGHRNGPVRGCRTVIPSGWNVFRKELGALSVWVYCVAGDQLGMSPLEAMACGLPVVMGTYPETGLFAFDDWNCCLARSAPFASVEWIAARARELLMDPEKREALGTAARATIREFFPLPECGRLWREALFA